MIYGELDFMYLGGNQVQILPNMYDFDTGAETRHPWHGPNSKFWRNIGTKAGNVINGPGLPYLINFDKPSALTRFPK